METSSRLIPLVDDLTHILVEAGKNKLTKRIKLDGGWPTVNLRGAERRDVMANKMYKTGNCWAAPDKQSGKWAARITIAHTMRPAGLFDTEEEAETYALKFATEYIDGRTK